MPVINNSYYPDYQTIEDGETKITITNTLKELWENGNLPLYEIFNSSNVFTTINPEKNNLVLPCTSFSTITGNIDPSSKRVTSVTVQNSGELRKVNLRFMLTPEKNIYSEYQSEIFKITNPPENFSFENNYTWQLPTPQSKTVTINTINTISNFNMINSMDISKVMFFVGEFIFIKNGNTVKYNFTDIKPADNTPQGQFYSAEAWENGYSDDLGQCIGVIGVGLYHKKGAWNDKFNSNYRQIYPVFEFVYDNEIYYSGCTAFRFTQQSVSNISFTYADYALDVNGQQYSYINNVTTSSMIANNTTILKGENEADYLTFISPSPFSDMDITLSEYSGYNMVGNNVFTKSGNYNFNMSNYKTSPKQIMQLLACMCIPFTFAYYGSLSYTSYDDNVYCGIKNEKGEAEGDYIQGAEISNLPDIKRGDFLDPDFEPYNPFAPAEPTEENEGDDIIPPTWLLVSGANNFVTQYLLNGAQLRQFGLSLWAKLQVKDFWSDIIGATSETLSINPGSVLQYVVSLRCYPIRFADLASIGYTSDTNIYIGRGSSGVNVSGATIGILDTTAESINGGTVYVPAKYNNFVDNMSTVECYIPYCGTVQLNPAEVIGGTLSLRYHVDFASGNICAVLSVTKGTTYPVAIVNGQIGATIQLTAGGLQQNIFGGFRDLLPTSNDINTGIDPVFLNQLSGVAGIGAGIFNDISGGLIGPSGSNTPHTVGTSNGFCNFGTPQKAYIKIIRKIMTNPTNYNSTVGNAVSKNIKLADCAGFTRCVNPDVTGIPCTETERNEIYNLLQSGVFL